MASLTDNIGGVQSAARVIDPQNDKAPSFMQGLAQIAETAITGGSRLFERNEADNARKAAADAVARKNSTEDATAGLIIDHGLGRGQFAPPQQLRPEPQQTSEGGYVPIDSSLEGPPLPDGVERVVGEVVRNRSAEAQGRAPTGSTRISLESAISQLRAEHPDQDHVILDYIKSQGFDHYLFRERDLNRKLEDSEIDTVQKGMTDYYNAAIQDGAIAPGTPFEAGAEVGRVRAQEALKLKMAKEARDAQAAESEANRSQFLFRQGQGDRDAVAAGIRMAGASMAPLMTQFESLAVEALQDPNNTTTFEAAVPEFARAIANMTNQTALVMANNGATETQIKSFREQMKGYEENLIGFTSGPLSQFAQSKRTLESLQTATGLNFQEALPTYMALKEVLGQGGLDAIFPAGVASVLPPEVIKQLRGEMSGIVGAINTDPERVSLENIAQLLRGQTNINRMSEEQARRTLPTIVGVARGAASEYVQRGTSGDTFFNATLNVSNAAAGLQPGTTREGGRSLVVASGALFGPTAATAIHKFRRENPDEGQQLVESTRSSAIHLLKGLQSRQLSGEETQGIWQVRYATTGPNAGKYENFLSRQQYDNWARTQTRGFERRGPDGPVYVPGRSVPTYEEMARNPPAALNEHVGAMNLNLGFLVSTKDYDEDFAGTTVREVRDFFATGEVPPAMARRTQGENGGKSFNERVQQLRSDFASVSTATVEQQVASTRDRNPAPPPRGELQTTVRDRAERMGLPWSLVNRLVAKESTWDANAINTKTQSRGLFQINDDRTDRSLDENINDGLGMVKMAMERANQVLGRPAFDWETYVVHQQGTGGGGALLNPANASKNVLDVLTPAYSGNRRRAEQAIINNGGSTSMTAAQFAQSIKNFFEG